MISKRHAVLLLTVLALVITLVFPAVPSVAGEHQAVEKAKETTQEECSVCGMWIDLYMKTHHVVTLADGTTKSFCSIACTAKYLRQHEGEVKRVQAADFETKELLDAEKVFYLEGSDIPGVMSYTSRIAFATREQAERYQKEYGGKIISFKEALENIAQE